MIILYAAGPSVDQARLDKLLTQYDLATMSAEKETLAAQVEQLVAPTVRSMLAGNLGGLGLGGDDLASLTTEAVRRALRESGLTRLKRQDIVPETLLNQMQTTQRGQALWNLLPPQLQQDLGAKYIKGTVGQQLADELSRLLEMPDLAGKLGERGDVIPSMVERTRANAELLHRLYPAAVKDVKAPPRNLLGYVKTTILPELKRRLLREKQPGVSDTMRADWNIVRPHVEALRAELRRDPSADEVYQRYRGDVETRTKPARLWMESEIKRIRPQAPFAIRTPIDLKVAREMLAEAGVDPKLYRDPGAPNYIAKRDVKPLGKKVVERLVQVMSAHSAQSAEQVLPYAPAQQSQPETPDWALFSQMVGINTKEKLQNALVSRLFGGQQYGAERAVANFLGAHPTPSAQDIQKWLSTLPDDVAEDVRETGFDAIAREVDRRLGEALSDVQLRDEVAADLGLSRGTADRTAGRIRAAIFARNSRRIVLAIKGNDSMSVLPDSIDAALPDDRARMYFLLVEILFGYPGLNTLKAVGQFQALNPLATANDISEYLDSLPPHMARAIRKLGWYAVAELVDGAIVQELMRPEIRVKLCELLDLPPECVCDVAASVRRQVQARAACGVRRAS